MKIRSSVQCASSHVPLLALILALSFAYLTPVYFEVVSRALLSRPFIADGCATTTPPATPSMDPMPLPCAQESTMRCPR